MYGYQRVSHRLAVVPSTCQHGYTIRVCSKTILEELRSSIAIMMQMGLNIQALSTGRLVMQEHKSWALILKPEFGLSTVPEPVTREPVA